MKLGLKINNQRKSEQEYRAIKGALNYSLMKMYEYDKRRFYKEAILGEAPVEKETSSKAIGSLVHQILATGVDGKEFEQKFHILQCKPLSETTHMYKLVENLYARTLKSIDENGVQQDKFETIFNDAYHMTKYNYAGEEVMFKNKDIDKVLAMFQADGELVYKEKLDCIGKTVINISQIEQAEKLTNKLKNHEYTAHIVNQEPSEDMDVLIELPIEFQIAGVKYKCMPDRMHVLHNKKQIQSYDYKTSWEAGNPESVYLKMGYWIQLGIYDRGIKEWTKEHPELEGYEVLPMQFIMIDTQGFLDPIIMTPSQDDIERAWRGFTVAGRVYRGIQAIVDDISWSAETGQWGTNRQLKDSGGCHTMRIRYGSR